MLWCRHRKDGVTDCMVRQMVLTVSDFQHHGLIGSPEHTLLASKQASRVKGQCNTWVRTRPCQRECVALFIAWGLRWQSFGWLALNPCHPPPPTSCEGCSIGCSTVGGGMDPELFGPARARIVA